MHTSSRLGASFKLGTQTNHTSAAHNNSSLLLEKLNVRHSTPDSEALASSDDEDPSNRQDAQGGATFPSRTARRASWLNDTTQSTAQARRSSFASNSLSPATSHPSTPSTEIPSWTQGQVGVSGPASKGLPGHSTLPWATAIWTTESRKEPPSRLTEVMPRSEAGTSNMLKNAGLHTTLTREQSHDPFVPFAMPLHPTPKTYRSQSYSVGQLEPEFLKAVPGHVVSASSNVRNRAVASSSSLQHRPSRPSMLSEISTDGPILGKVREDDNDDGDSTGFQSFNQDPESSSRFRMTQARAIEELAKENAILRQQSLNSNRARTRPSANASSNTYAGLNSYSATDALLEESEYAVDEVDEGYDFQELINYGTLARRMSAFAVTQTSRNPGSSFPENRKLENVKKAHWQSNLDFGGASDSSPSRRHSFADVPPRNVVPTSRDPLAQDLYHEHSGQQQQSMCAGSALQSRNDHVVPYFTSGRLPGHDPDTSNPQTLPLGAYHSRRASHYGQGRSASPHRSVYGVPQSRPNQLLYVVLFKCSRADVFCAQEGTGLTIKPGDLVIVEADRGTDLGTVAQENVDWIQAKQLKDHHAEEHYKWLMMYSQGAVGTSDGTGAGLMATTNGLLGSAVGGMGPSHPQGVQEPSLTDLKPKIIKRLAQPHEIQALRDKEGNEAKAKRVCMQKVKEHGLHMEILDAEFQIDWKKLTFYYFADAYINFNSLVTDLFKIYKTRIWMSAINPASFASPTLGLQVPSGIGPGAIGINRPNVAPPQMPQQEVQNLVHNYQSLALGGQYQAFNDADQLRTGSYPQAEYAYAHQPFSPWGASDQMTRYQPSMYTPSVQQPNYSSRTTYQPPAQHTGMPGPNGNGKYSRQAQPYMAENDAWIAAIHRLSLNTR